jgi:deoxycytidylate deaminase
LYFQNVVFSAGLFDFLAMGFASVYAKRSEAVKYQMMACIVNERNTGAISQKKSTSPCQRNGDVLPLGVRA